MGSCCAMLPCLRYRLLLTHTKQLPHTLMQRAFLGEPSGRQVVAAAAGAGEVAEVEHPAAAALLAPEGCAAAVAVGPCHPRRLQAACQVHRRLLGLAAAPAVPLAAAAAGPLAACPVGHCRRHALR